MHIGYDAFSLFTGFNVQNRHYLSLTVHCSSTLFTFCLKCALLAPVLFPECQAFSEWTASPLYCDWSAAQFVCVGNVTAHTITVFYYQRLPEQLTATMLPVEQREFALAVPSKASPRHSNTSDKIVPGQRLPNYSSVHGHARPAIRHALS